MALLRTFLVNAKAQNYPAITRNGEAAYVVRSVATNSKEARQSAYMPQAVTTVYVLIGDCKVLGLDERNGFQDLVSGQNFEITREQSHDAAMPYRVFSCVLVK